MAGAFVLYGPIRLPIRELMLTKFVFLPSLDSKCDAD